MALGDDIFGRLSDFYEELSTEDQLVMGHAWEVYRKLVTDLTALYVQVDQAKGILTIPVFPKRLSGFYTFSDADRSTGTPPDGYAALTETYSITDTLSRAKSLQNRVVVTPDATLVSFPPISIRGDGIARVSNVVTVSTLTVHRFQAGHQVEISGTTGGFDGTVIVTRVLSPARFEFNDVGADATGGGGVVHRPSDFIVSDSLIYVAPGTFHEGGVPPSSVAVTSALRSANLVTVTAALHPFVTGDDVEISLNATPSFNGTFTVIVVDPNTFTFRQVGPDIAASLGGLAEEVRPIDDAWRTEDGVAGAYATIEEHDYDWMARNFGSIYRHTGTSSETYLRELQGLGYAYWGGPAVRNLELALTVVSQLPFAVGGEVGRLLSDGAGGVDVEIGDELVSIPSYLTPTIEARSSLVDRWEVVRGVVISGHSEGDAQATIADTSLDLEPGAHENQWVQFRTGSYQDQIFRITANTADTITIQGKAGDFTLDAPGFGDVYLVLADETSIPTSIVSGFRPVAETWNLVDLVRLVGHAKRRGANPLEEFHTFCAQIHADIVSERLSRGEPIDFSVASTLLERAKPTWTDYCIGILRPVEDRLGLVTRTVSKRFLVDASSTMAYNSYDDAFILNPDTGVASPYLVYRRWGIHPVLPTPVSGVVGNGTDSVSFLLTSNHDLEVGEAITVSGVDDPAFDGAYTVAMSTPGANFFVATRAAGAIGGNSGGGLVDTGSFLTEDRYFDTTGEYRGLDLDDEEFPLDDHLRLCDYFELDILAATWLAGTATITTAVVHNIPPASNIIVSGVKINILSATWAAGTATITTDGDPGEGHGITFPNTVSIEGVSLVGYNGSYALTAVPAGNLLEYVIADPGGAGVGGTVYHASIPYNGSFVVTGIPAANQLEFALVDAMCDGAGGTVVYDDVHNKIVATDFVGEMIGEPCTIA